MRLPLCAKAEQANAQFAPDEFFIDLDKVAGTRLGVDVDHQDDSTLLIDAVTGGLIGAWNDAHPDQMVMVGDRIVEANGRSGNVLEIVDEIKKNQALKLKIRQSDGRARKTAAATREARICDPH